MSRTTTLPPKTHVIQSLAVAGPDLDPSLVAKLTAGDKIMVEVNGTRMFSESACPLVAEVPWTVEQNTPPILGQRPASHHKIVLSHRWSNQLLELHYCNLIHAAPKQPAVFYERHVHLSATAAPTTPIYVILQLVSHFIPATNLNFIYEPHDLESARLVLTDETLRAAVIAEWVELLGNFHYRIENRSVWEHRSVYRLSMRSFLTPNILLAFKNEDWEAIATLNVETLIKIHEAIHWLPHFLEQGRLAVARDTQNEDAAVNE